MASSSRLNTLLYTLPILLTTSLVSAQQGDGGAATGNVPVTAGNGDVAGASGQSTGIVRLSTGAIVAIAVVVTVVVIGGILTATLFYQAKKRQWTVRETLRHSRRRVTTGLQKVMSPLTPHRATFSPGPLKTRFSDKETKDVRGGGRHGPSPLAGGGIIKSNKKVNTANHGIGLDVDMDNMNNSKVGRGARSERDLEKGVVVGVSENEAPRRHKPQKPSITVPIVGKPVEQSPKTPMLNRVFGRN